MSGIMITGNGIPLYRLRTLKRGVELEEMGMRLFRGRTCTAMAKEMFGLSRGTKRAKVLARIEQAIEEAQANLQPGDITSF